MKVKIEKQPHGTLRVELPTDPSKRPLVAELSPGQAHVLVQILDAAIRAERFKFELEL